MMKTLIAAVVLCFGACFNAVSQGLFVRQSAEKTAFGAYSGVSLHYVNRNGIQFGTFYSTRTGWFDEHQSSDPVSERYFWGISSSYPLTHFRKVNFHAQLRVGSTNQTKLTYSPALAATFHPTKRIAIETGLSNRIYGYSAFLNLRFAIKSFKDMEFEGGPALAKASRYF